MAFQRLSVRPLSACADENNGKTVGLEGENGSVTARKMAVETLCRPGYGGKSLVHRIVFALLDPR
jgi:hypothetical protein